MTYQGKLKCLQRHYSTRKKNAYMAHMLMSSLSFLPWLIDLFLHLNAKLWGRGVYTIA
jgi:hypothetical protein